MPTLTPVETSAGRPGELGRLSRHLLRRPEDPRNSCPRLRTARTTSSPWTVLGFGTLKANLPPAAPLSHKVLILFQEMQEIKSRLTAGLWQTNNATKTTPSNRSPFSQESSHVLPLVRRSPAPIGLLGRRISRGSARLGGDLAKGPGIFCDQRPIFGRRVANRNYFRIQ